MKISRLVGRETGEVIVMIMMPQNARDFSYLILVVARVATLENGNRLPNLSTYMLALIQQKYPSHMHEIAIRRCEEEGDLEGADQNHYFMASFSSRTVLESGSENCPSSNKLESMATLDQGET